MDVCARVYITDSQRLLGKQGAFCIRYRIKGTVERFFGMLAFAEKQEKMDEFYREELVAVSFRSLAYLFCKMPCNAITLLR